MCPSRRLRRCLSWRPPAPVAAPVVEAAAAPQSPVPAEPAPPAAAEVVASAAESATDRSLPSFLPGAAAASVDSYCNRVSLATGSNGGFVTAAAMSDPLQALGEQFCLARTYAVEQGDSLAGTVQGFSMAEMEEQCEAFAPSMAGYQARLASEILPVSAPRCRTLSLPPERRRRR